LTTGDDDESDDPALFAWLPAGGTRLVNITVPGPEANSKWRDVYGMQWDGAFFALDSGQAIYREALIHGQAYYVGSTTLSGGHGLYGFYSAKQSSQASVVAAPASSNTVGLWDYPAGGEIKSKITHGVDAPSAVVISPS
jgi:hypothetical protein